MGYPRGLIRNTTQNAIDGKPTRVLRPRILVYGTLLIALIVAWSWGIGHRSMLIAEVLRDRNALYRIAEAGLVENAYTLKLVNKDEHAQSFRLRLESSTPGIVLRGGVQQVQAGPGQVLSIPVVAQAPADTAGRHELHFVVESADGRTRRTIDSSFFGPM
jgi:polyferredoxin